MKKIAHYATDARDYLNTCKRKYSAAFGDEGEDSSPELEPGQELDDMEFIKEYYKNKNGRMNWANCYAEGRKKYFKKYMRPKALKNMYHRKK
ncbi:hypothetical protein DFQ28_003444 [Apophysomyces sp. BC1034]|nr:hypothetical protein DFQ30_001450 [Apophysomyces sp. BC1015]KAG0182965.1 hypothetical protein DFQ29_001109 [Apophysomyces sp. BC1021]KAG0193773.1 hypothetical protein DFQ28_003444 [Apophysomyces sp. BC1034]